MGQYHTEENMKSPEQTPEILKIHKRVEIGPDNVDTTDGTKEITLLVAGQVDLASTQYFDGEIHDALNGAKRDGTKEINIDLGAVDYFGASGANGLVRACAKAEEQGTRITVVNPSWIVHRVINILQLEQTIPIKYDGQ